MSEVELSAIFGVVLSLAFSYIPGLNTKFAALSPEFKRLIMLGGLALIGVAVYGLSCLGWFSTGVTCDQAGALELVKAFVAAAIANQTALQCHAES